jgi:hypothetical protein
VAELVDAADSKSAIRKDVLVRFQSWAQKERAEKQSDSEVSSALLFPSAPPLFSRSKEPLKEEGISPLFLCYFSGILKFERSAFLSSCHVPYS